MNIFLCLIFCFLISINSVYGQYYKKMDNKIEDTKRTKFRVYPNLTRIDPMRPYPILKTRKVIKPMHPFQATIMAESSGVHQQKKHL